MRIFIHGNDRGNAMLTTLVFIIVLSTIFVTFVPYVITMKRSAHENKTQVIRSIEQSYWENINLYDTH
jgi:competence protein ComGC